MKNKEPRKTGSERVKKQTERLEEERIDDTAAENPLSPSGSGRDHSGASDRTRKLMGWPPALWDQTVKLYAFKTNVPDLMPK